MGLSVLIILTCCNVVISALRKIIPNEIRLAIFVVVIAGFVTIVDLLLQAFIPALSKSLGVFIPLIVVNCIILGRAEAFAAKNGAVESLMDGIGIGLGFTIGLTLLGICRELLGAGSVFGFILLPETYNMLMFVLPPGAFITLGFLVAVINKFKK
jgi:electron transport complex protein RnfE